MKHWTGQSDASHTLELMERELERVRKQNARGDSSYDELVDAREDVDRARMALAVYESERAAGDVEKRAQMVARRWIGGMGVGGV